MVGRRTRVGTVVAAAALAVTGCVGETDPATDVSHDAATLRGHGTTGQQGTDTWFRYEPVLSNVTQGANVFAASTPTRRWPGDVSGPLSERVSALFPGTRYGFRLCGRDVGASEAVCAQVRTLTTPGPPGRDYLSAGWWDVYPHAYAVRLRAQSGPRGESPTGTLTHTNPQEFQGRVTCLEVSGQRAVVGVTASFGVSRLYAFDAVAKTGALATSPVSTPPNCKTATFGTPQRLPNTFVNVGDVP